MGFNINANLIRSCACYQRESVPNDNSEKIDLINLKEQKMGTTAENWHSDNLGELTTAENGHSDYLEELTAAENGHSDNLGELTTAENGHSVNLGELTTSENGHSDNLEELTTSENGHSVNLGEFTTAENGHSANLGELTTAGNGHSVNLQLTCIYLQVQNHTQTYEQVWFQTTIVPGFTEGLFSVASQSVTIAPIRRNCCVLHFPHLPQHEIKSVIYTSNPSVVRVWEILSVLLL